MRFRMFFQHVSGTFPYRVSEWMLAFMLFSWGLVMVHPSDSFSQAIMYKHMAEIAPDSVWGWSAMVIACFRLVALIVNGFWVPPSFHMRSVTSFISCAFWFAISFELLVSGLIVPALGIYPWLFITELISLYRTARDYATNVAAYKALRGSENVGRSYSS